MIKKLFNRKKKAVISYSNKEGYGEIIYENDHVILVHDSCRICYNKNVENTFDEKLKYIAGKIKVGHESILEHSNVVIRINVTKELYPEIVELLNSTRYLSVITKDLEDRVEIVLGGSIRAYKHVIRTMRNSKNKVYEILLNLMYELPYCYFTDMIEDGIFDRTGFLNVDKKVEVKLDDEGNSTGTKRKVTKIMSNSGKFDIVGFDSLVDILDNLNNTNETYTLYDILDLASISILFKKVSRTASHQLVRHRAGITQLSQRYVDMTDCEFLSPDMFKEELDSDKKYSIMIQLDKETQEGVGQFLTLKETGEMINSIYPQLVNQGLLKEDARSYLASNIETSLYMTFTMRNFIKFLELRTHKAAQAEIRLLALEALDIFNDLTDYIFDRPMYDYILPYYIFIQNELSDLGEQSIDEVISEKEEIIEEIVE